MAYILTADDDPVIRDLVRFRLERDGHEVQTTESGLDLIAAAQVRRPDLVILDVMMPGLNGVDTARTLRADEVLHDIPIIMLTARIADADIEHGFVAGANDYLAKPFRPRELSLRVTALLSRSQA